MADSMFRSVRRATFLVSLVVAAIVGALLITAVWRVVGAFSNPFATKKVDRTSPALMTALTDLARVEGSSGTFQVVVDIEEDTKNLPASLKGERIIYLAQGSASGTVDLSRLTGRAIVTDEKLKTAKIIVPRAEISNVRIDLTKSKVLSHQRGIIDRIEGAIDDESPMNPDLAMLAEKQLKAAADESELRARAEQNTRLLLTSIATGLGYTSVTVEFGEVQPNWPTVPTSRAA